MMMEDSQSRVSSTPSFIDGTAWKEERTEALVTEAIAAGFRGIDTANQRRHYHEAAVGNAIRKSRESLFVQTKFTYVESQDQRLPYDPAADYPTQVRQSLTSSLERLGHVDSFVLHGPRTRSGLSSIDRDVWRTMEELQREGGTRLIGISNATADQLALLCDTADVRPTFRLCALRDPIRVARSIGFLRTLASHRPYRREARVDRRWQCACHECGRRL